VRVPDLRRPLPPRPLTHAAVPLPPWRAGGVGGGRRGDLLARPGCRRRLGRVLRGSPCRPVLCSGKQRNKNIAISGQYEY
jgi:hypothetical protein